MPAKQYVYGLHLLSNDARNTKVQADFQELLRGQGAPEWPPESKAGDIKSLLKSWCIAASRLPYCDGIWWSFLEMYALQALACKPGMDLGVFTTPSEVRRLTVVNCGAAKEELYPDQATGDGKRQFALSSAILGGKSLELLGSFDGAADPVDSIGEIMVPAQSLKQRFGGEIRHLLYKARRLHPR